MSWQPGDPVPTYYIPGDYDPDADARAIAALVAAVAYQRVMRRRWK